MGALTKRSPVAPRSRADIEAALRAIPEATEFVRTAGSFSVRAEGEEAFTVELGAADPVSLAALRLVGTGSHMAIRIACALVPLYGPLELKTGLGPDLLIDGLEPSRAIIDRHQAALVAHLAGLRETFQQFFSSMAPTVLAGTQVRARRARSEMKKLGLLIAVLSAALGAYWFFGAWLPRRPVDAHCKANADCRSSECLPQEPSLTYGFAIPDFSLQLTHPEGVCTDSCAADGDCPGSMRCDEVEQREGYDGFDIVTSRTRVRRCVPRAWTGPTDDDGHGRPAPQAATFGTSPGAPALGGASPAGANADLALSETVSPVATLGALPSVATAMNPPDDFDLRCLGLGGLSTAHDAHFPGDDVNAAIWRRGDVVQGAAATRFAVPTSQSGAPAVARGLPFWVRQIATRQAAYDAPPWHGGGGTWTFVDAMLGGGRVLVGFQVTPAAFDRDAQYESGEVRLVAFDRVSADRVIASLADYLRMPSPAPARSGSSRPRVVSGRIGLFGRHLGRDMGDRFQAGEGGDWTLAKLTLTGGDDTAELYFAFNPTERIGEFTEKEPEFREPAAKILLGGLRAR